jgi:hypothetical protein
MIADIPQQLGPRQRQLCERLRAADARACDQSGLSA